MPKKKVVKKKVKVVRRKSSGYGQLFDTHPNLKWLLPAMLLAIFAFVLLYSTVPAA